MCIYHMVQVSVGALRDHQILLELELQEVVSCPTWVLQTELRSCGTRISTLNH